MKILNLTNISIKKKYRLFGLPEIFQGVENLPVLCTGIYLCTDLPRSIPQHRPHTIPFRAGCPSITIKPCTYLFGSPHVSHLTPFIICRLFFSFILPLFGRAGLFKYGLFLVIFSLMVHPYQCTTTYSCVSLPYPSVLPLSQDMLLHRCALRPNNTHAFVAICK